MIPELKIEKHSYVTSCEILRGDQNYFDRLIQLINESQEILHLQIYIFNNDTTGELVQTALLKAAKRGVEVTILLDGIGSRHLPKIFLNKFFDAGIEVQHFSKIRFRIPFRIGRRLHIKLIVADSKKAMVGGINISDNYRGNHNQLPWFDYGVYLEGSICKYLHNLAEKILKKRNFEEIRIKGLWRRNAPKQVTEFNVLENDFFKHKLQVRKSYYQAFNKAQHSIVLFASYFLPNFKLLRLLEHAAARGVIVKLVLPEKTDVRFYKTAVQYLYPRLIKNGIKLYEYSVTMMHAKVATVDESWCTIGSYNLNDLSDLLSIELNIEIVNKFIASNFNKELEEVIQQDCKEVQPEDYKHPSIFSKWIRRIYYVSVLYILRFLYWLSDKNKDYIQHVKTNSLIENDPKEIPSQ